VVLTTINTEGYFVVKIDDSKKSMLDPTVVVSNNFVKDRQGKPESEEDQSNHRDTRI
jgi:hypothetical protein